MVQLKAAKWDGKLETVQAEELVSRKVVTKAPWLGQQTAVVMVKKWVGRMGSL